MPAVLDRPTTSQRLQEVRRLQTEIARLEQRLATLFAGVPKHLLTRNDYGFTDRQMSTIARNLHARTKERIAAGRGKKFRGSIEELL